MVVLAYLNTTAGECRARPDRKAWRADGSNDRPVRSSFIALLALIGACCLSPPTLAEVMLNTGQYTETTVDLQVKVLGGYVRALRTLVGSKWYFNRAWGPLEIEEDSTDPIKYAIRSISRGGRRYGGGGSFLGMTTFYLNSRQWISVHPGGGYVWRDIDGNWIAYDEHGRVNEYGDKNNVKVSIRYDNEGRRSGVFDHHGRQVLWYEYDEASHIAAVRDLANRRVQYHYTGDLLTSITDVMGNAWRYTYDHNGRLQEKIDPEGRVTKLGHNVGGMVAADSDWAGTQTSYAYTSDSADGSFYVRTITNGGRTDEYWYDSDAVLIRHDLNGSTIQRVERERLGGETNAQPPYRQGPSTGGGSGGSTGGAVWTSPQKPKFFPERRTITDRYGNRMVVAFDEWQNLTHIAYPDGSSENRTYKPGTSLLTSHTNERRVVTTFEYDSRGNMARITEALGSDAERSVAFSYDSYGQVVDVWRSAKGGADTTHYLLSYDESGNLAAVVDPGSHKYTFRHDVTGQTVLTRGPTGATWMVVYGVDGKVREAVDPLGNSRKVEYDKSGLVIRYTDALGAVWSLAYDFSSRTIVRRNPLGHDATLSFSEDGREWRFVDEGGRVRSVRMDAEGRPERLQGDDGRELSYEYGTWVGDGGKAGSGRRVIVRSGSETRELSYDSRGRLARDAVFALGVVRVQTYTRDPRGNIEKHQDWGGRIVEATYDALDRVATLMRPAAGIVTLSYDGDDNIVRVHDGNSREYVFGYDRQGNMVHVTWPDKKKWILEYDEEGQLKTVYAPSGRRSVYVRDLNGRTRQRLHYRGVGESEPERRFLFEYDANGRLTAYGGGNAWQRYERDLNGRITLARTEFEGIAFSRTQQYDRSGRKVAVTDVDGETYRYTYDDRGRLVSVKFQEGGSIGLSYDELNRLEVLRYPGGTTRTYGYDGLSQISELTVRDGAGTVLHQVRYTYDAAGNVVSAVGKEGEESYEYDSADRIIGEHTRSGVLRYAYDSVGNRTKLQQDGVESTWAYSAANELRQAGQWSYVYDLDGRVVERRGGDADVALVYDAVGALQEVRSGNGGVVAAYETDALGQRVSKEVEGRRTLFVYADEGLVAEYDVGTARFSTFGVWPGSGWGGGALFARDSQGYVFRQVDRSGRPYMALDASGKVTWEGRHGAFGNRQVVREEIDERFAFPGQYMDEETGFYYNGARYYEPETGRYLSPDPKGLPGMWSQYAYALGNPLRWQDPYGLEPSVGGGGMRQCQDYCVDVSDGTVTMDGSVQSFVDALGEFLDDGRPPRNPNPLDVCADLWRWVQVHGAIDTTMACAVGLLQVPTSPRDVLLWVTQEAIRKLTGLEVPFSKEDIIKAAIDYIGRPANRRRLDELTRELEKRCRWYMDMLQDAERRAKAFSEKRFYQRFVTPGRGLFGDIGGATSRD